MDVRFDGVVFRRGARVVLDVPALTIAGDQTTAVLGENGAGKSTLLRLVAGLERATDGRITLDGTPAGSPEARDAIAYAFQQAVFLSGTVEANLELALRLRRVDEQLRTRRVRETAEACGIGELLGRRASSLSGGEAQRANLARALCLRAPVTLLDEPLAGLDGPARRGLLAELPGLLQAFAATTVLVTHDPEEALRLSSQVVILAGGTVIAAGETRAVLNRPPNPETAAFLGFDLLRGEDELVGVPPGALSLEQGGVTFEMIVERVIDLGSRIEVSGEVAGRLVAASLPAGSPPPEAGARVPVGADEGLLVRFRERSAGGDVPH